ncbi:phospho-acceptor domain-containing protein [Anaerobacterium chartisolvens]|uniref:histidine kinase n=1 Tax=Anaerobacterium chartisolvens TaxID=1297424 RepID=A0A369AMH2_9FIRM|nr:ATP-binding protein [Anaerobacterium chartisolvens]RCX10371.1 phospho-acceptor domain-containing protein [Anaerobacterium chartisolvens]
MKFGLKSKLSVSYVLVAIACVALLSYLTNFLLERHFTAYVIQKQERENNEIVSLLVQQYRNSGVWDAGIIENVGVSALERGMIIKVTASDGTVIWDAAVHNSGWCRRMLDNMAHNMLSRYPGWEGNYTTKTYPVFSREAEAGKVEIGYYGPYYYTDNDLAFISTLNNLLIYVGIFSLVFALVIGQVMARRLSKPIIRVIDTARMISKGHFGDSSVAEISAEGSTTKEISQLITAIKDLAETLEKQELLRKRLTADVAHELRTPIATLQSHMEAMIDGIWQPDIERLKSCHEEAIRIGGLVDDLERLARYESEGLVLNRTEFDIYPLIEHILKNFESGFFSKNIALALYGKGELVFADRDKISQLIINLLSNALKYTPEGGSVEIRLCGDGDDVKITVKDNGAGIHEEDLPYIFERFYRADKSRNRATGGSGIGLSIAKAIAEAHGGSIEVKSEAGAGSEFTLKLPRKPH